VTFGEEGGKANVAGDHGGPTNMGITAATLAEAQRRGVIRLSATIDNLRRDEAE
jgi:lysozyme family protein